MKARAFLLAILATALILLSLGLGGWWMILQSSVLRLQGQQLHIPAAARFIPRTALMSFHCLTTPEWPVNYARAVALPGQRNRVEETITTIRDEIFLLAGLDYSHELKNWVGNEISFALLPSSDGNDEGGWLLALSSRDFEASRRFLQRFWETRRVSNSSITISNYRGIGVINGQSSLHGQKNKLFATALIDNTLLLIASSPSILQEALDVSEIDELNQAHDPNILGSIDEMRNGVALLLLHPDTVGSKLNVSRISDNSEFPEVVATLESTNSTLVINSLFHFNEGLPTFSSTSRSTFLQDLGGDIQILGFSNGPNLLENTEIIDNYPWLVTLVNNFKDTIVKYRGSFFSSVVQATFEPFIWVETPKGWLIGTSPKDPDPSSLTNNFKKQDLVEAPLLVDNFPTKIWTHLKANKRSSKLNDQPLEAALIGARQESDNFAWWAQNLEVLRDRKQDPRGGVSILTQLESLNAKDSSYGLVLAAEPARTLIGKWKAWSWLEKLSNRQLTSRVQGIAVNVSPSQISNNNVSIKVSISFH
ncbi:hypothetical protein PMYN1_Chma282 (chromatophore) [Paulinella micropora]|uniref:DUF3352 domain-containing protein n=1 Tax=Paulinella micropora TaxID=1928728 RepID=A0A1S6YHT7_9EUKA|nr:hypothetical protein PFK_323 [Paulinella micropora]BBL86091.1 hypothetical protein PMYN1_Chma282 [Paulinella micropora]